MIHTVALISMDSLKSQILYKNFPFNKVGYFLDLKYKPELFNPKLSKNYTTTHTILTLIPQLTF